MGKIDIKQVTKNCGKFSESLEGLSNSIDSRKQKDLMKLYKTFYASYKDFYAEDARKAIKHPKYLLKKFKINIKTDLSNMKRNIERLNLESVEDTTKEKKWVERSIQDIKGEIKGYKKLFPKESKNDFIIGFKNKTFLLERDLEKFNELWSQHLSKFGELKVKYLSKNEDESVLFSIARNGDENLSDEGREELKSWINDLDNKFNNLKNKLLEDVSDIESFLITGTEVYKEQYDSYTTQKEELIPGVKELKAVKMLIKKGKKKNAIVDEIKKVVNKLKDIKDKEGVNERLSEEIVKIFNSINKKKK